MGTRLSAILYQPNENQLFFSCPGCKELHTVRIKGDYAWQWNGDVERPTFSPSILVTAHSEYRSQRCHSFVRDGQIQFLDDCNHALAGQTVPLPEVEI